DATRRAPQAAFLPETERRIERQSATYICLIVSCAPISGLPGIGFFVTRGHSPSKNGAIALVARGSILLATSWIGGSTGRYAIVDDDAAAPPLAAAACAARTSVERAGASSDTE